MAEGKTAKALAKRLKVTRRGKILARRAGQDHFRAKKAGVRKLQVKRLKPLPLKKKDLSRFLPYGTS